ncbi:NmrA family NAD(P)-binding protein [Actinomycetospora endophytica]|uniref:NmrA family NAD(P)-binding protein n=1 Tax=Actinomycetospora endophytica TaxID=2291215 RepID=A0ABS8P3I1_9PSEU|nr:NmrA family NAD(P)-binding protein [Actinomycetospora endophytica]MCD2192811.1 NmrA family NAD(P)-binding protein [Actinomycetospora endophytica]
MYVVTGATGALGRLAVEALLERVPAAEVRATGRRIEALDDLAARGVDVRRADYDDPASLAAAFEGATRVLFVSGSDAGARIEQHRAVVEALATAGVELAAYTSILHAQSSDMILAGEHAATEKMLAAAGVPSVLLRNGWYVEYFTANLAVELEQGVVGASGDGRFDAATRADYAEAAVAALTGGASAGDVLELGGPGFTRAELAAEIGRAAGREVTYTDLGVAGFTEALVAAGLPEGFATVLADSDRGAAAGLLAAPGDDLTRLLGRPATPWTAVIDAAVREVVAPA